MTDPKRRWFRFSPRTLFVVVTALSCGVGWMIYQNREGKPVEFVVPNGFYGTIVVIKDNEKGRDLNVERGTYVFQIPNDGTVHVKDTRPFQRWHTEQCRDSAGRARELQSLGVSISGSGSTADNGAEFRWEVR